MTKMKFLTGGLALALCSLILTSLTGCFAGGGGGYVEGSGYVGVYAPETVVFGGYGRSHDYDRDAGRRGAVSRGVSAPRPPSRGGGGRPRGVAHK